MVGRRPTQLGHFEADQLHVDRVGRSSFYGFPAGQRGPLFHDGDFAALYCLDNGRRSVPPSLLVTALLLPTYDAKLTVGGARQRGLSIFSRGVPNHHAIPPSVFCPVQSLVASR